MLRVKKAHHTSCTLHTIRLLSPDMWTQPFYACFVLK